MEKQIANDSRISLQLKKQQLNTIASKSIHDEEYNNFILFISLHE